VDKRFQGDGLGWRW